MEADSAIILNNTEHTYEYNEKLFTVNASEEFHERLITDDHFNSHYFEEVISKKQDVVNNTDERSTKGENLHFAWGRETTKLLVEEYKVLKMDFRDPKIKKKVLWGKIKRKFEENGHTITEDLLDRKWRNLKKTCTTIKDNTRKTGRGRISWEYFEDFYDIYFSDKTLHLPDTIPVQPLSAETTQVTSSITEILDTEEQYQTPEPPSGCSTPTNKKSANSNRKSGIYYLKKRHAEIEEKRVEEIKLLRLALERNNAIQEERNEIFKALLNKKL